ncbi:MAG: tRNA-dihydrouridine synthase family protein [Muribaculum sp.]|nr:tRNA-dihydrouridine synthase family protein [Muribaculum sp.]
MMIEDKIIQAAPVQGHTDAAWRHFHAEVYGPLDSYTTPFIRLEKGGVRKRDINDAFSPLNDNHHVVPQVIFRDINELSALVATLKDRGASAIDINMGCPFPLQTARGRGAATVARPEAAEALREIVMANDDISFSLKLRLGMTDTNEWRHLITTLNDLSFSSIALHPRVASIQYGGIPDYGAFAEFLAESRNPVIYNGDIRTPRDFAEITERFPDIAGVMLGRGLLGRPSLANEICEGKEWTHEKRLEWMRNFHNYLYDHYENTLEGGSHQLLGKIAPFWEYAEEEIGRKAWKGVKKAVNIAKYHSAFALI